MDAKNYNWQTHLKHERDIRDGYVACGNKKPDRPDPDGGVVNVPVYKFHGKVFFDFITPRGHSASNYWECKCSKPNHK